MKTDTIIVEVDPETGLIKTTTEALQGPNHSLAEQFLAYLARLAGGSTTVTPRTKTSTTHSHEKAKEIA